MIAPKPKSDPSLSLYRLLDPAVLAEWRSREAELVALNSVGLLARLTGARTIAAHVSQPTALDLLLRERALGARLLGNIPPNSDRRYPKAIEALASAIGALPVEG